MLDCVIDVSHHNGPVDFAQVKAAGVQAVILKATQGKAWIDPLFTKNMTNALTSGLLVGAYHFGNGDDSKAQADHFLSVAGSVPLKVLDFEENRSGQSMTGSQANDFIQHITKVKYPMIYADFSHIQQLHIFPLLAKECPLWIAQYRHEKEPQIPANTWTDWALWQYTQTGIVTGVEGKVDRSYFNGDLSALQSLFS